ncbi:MAG: hypothetical protein EOO87_08220 [Pedobacter sp.]|nr:MAG: hypothetical protein EOO87_08220 [Pedobacter sp.]
MENKFYQQNSDEYIVKRKLLVPILALAVFASLGVHSLINGTNHDGIPYYVFTFLPIGLYTYKLGRNVRINVVNKTVSENWFGLKLSTYNFNAISRYLLVKKTVNLINAGHGVSIAFRNDGKDEKEIEFAHLSKKQTAEEFLAETQRLIR